MNKTIHVILAILAALLVGWLLGRESTPSMHQETSADSGDREILYWVAPMDANYRRDEPGKSPMGMDLVPVYADEKASQPGVVSIDPTMVANLGVRIAVAQRGTLPRRVETVGYVGYDEDTLQHLHTRVEGWIENLAATAASCFSNCTRRRWSTRSRNSSPRWPAAMQAWWRHPVIDCGRWAFLLPTSIDSRRTVR
jgi:membrane fusion protein, copper/silver efflux system